MRSFARCLAIIVASSVLAALAQDKPEDTLSAVVAVQAKIQPNECRRSTGQAVRLARLARRAGGTRRAARR